MANKNNSTLQKPLEGIRVLDFAQFMAGPLCAMRLADLGAEVIKIERPNGGDMCRSLMINDQVFDGSSLLFHTLNRNKSSFAADLKNVEDLELVKRLIETADVMIHNFRPGVMERIGLGYEDVLGIKSDIIYGVVSGYGTKGPWVAKPGQDLLAQSMSGLTWLSGNEEDDPVPVGLPVLDMATGSNLVQGILAALLRRSTTGQGGLVEVDLMSTAFDIQIEPFTAFLNDNERQPKRSTISNANVYGAAPYGLFKTQDGFLAVAMTPISVLEKVFSLPEFAGYEQAEAFEKRDEIKAILRDKILTRTTSAWLEILEPADIWCAAVMNWNTLMEHDGFAALELVQEVIGSNGETFRTTRCPIKLDGGYLTSEVGAPALGANTKRIKSEI